MRQLLLSFSLVISGILSSTNYYVASKSGSDANNGTSPTTPFQTISKINTVLLSPGDSVLFCCGNIFRGQVNIKESGAEGKPIVIAHYGTGAPPCICGGEVIDGTWSVSSGNIYKTFLDFNPSYVFVNGICHTIAQTTTSVGEVLSNKLEYLDQEKEFFYDVPLQTLYLETKNNAAPSGFIEGSIYDYGINLSTPGQKFIVITGIDFTEQKNAGIFLPNNNSNIVVYHCDFINLTTAVAANRNNSSNYLQISYNYIRHAYRAGLLLENCFTAKIIGNSILNCSENFGITNWMNTKDSLFTSSSSAIEMNGHSSVIMENRIDSVAQSGISISGNNNVIYHNEISNCCLQLSDCGGIYCHHCNSILIKENIIHQIYFSKKNMASSSNSKYPAGILLLSEKSFLQDSLKIIGNTVYNCSEGISIYDLIETATIEKNILYNISSVAFQIDNQDRDAKKLSDKMKINANDFYVLGSGTSLIIFSNHAKTNPTLNFAVCDSNNYYFLTADANYKLENATSSRTCTIAQWKSAGYDQHGNFFTQTDLNKTVQNISADSLKKISSIERFPIYVNNSTQPKNLNLKAKGYMFVDGKPIPETITLPPCSSIILRNDNPPKGNAKTTNGRG